MGSPVVGPQREGDVFSVPDPRVSDALRFMGANLHDCSLTVADVAAQAGLSRSGFSRLFKVETGSSPGRMLARMRVQLAGDLLSGKGAWQVKEVVARAGFRRSDVFARAFREWYGTTPSEFRRSLAVCSWLGIGWLPELDATNCKEIAQIANCLVLDGNRDDRDTQIRNTRNSRPDGEADGRLRIRQKPERKGTARLMRAGLTGVLHIERLSLEWLIAAFTGIAIASATVSAPAMAADDIGRFVYVQSATAGSVTNGPTGRSIPVEARLVNASDQVITAYTLSVEVTLATGEQFKGEITRDMVSALVYERVGDTAPAGYVFGPGQTTGSTIFVKLPGNVADPVVVAGVLGRGTHDRPWR